MNNKVPTATASSPLPRAQCTRVVLEAEIWQDPDGGPDTLCVTTDELACEPTVPARLRRMVVDARATLDKMERLADEQEARDTLAAIVAENDLQVEEWNADSLDPKMRDRFVAFLAVPKKGRTIVVVPEGQDPVERVNAVAGLVADIEGRTAVQA
ncbi:hypothetical protein ACGFZ9_34210 [Streptomyces mirabilis]|uniref:hypothetical protein n=1 Tax=Streptomyces mirabilis TaxID=68239 RepID=UPI0037109E37